ncbi:MAG TPA: hypothetical protein H9664_01925 [Firmicutes bacterium]|nr:hypothetical protein [Bacillota bacterium]
MAERVYIPAVCYRSVRDEICYKCMEKREIYRRYAVNFALRALKYAIDVWRNGRYTCGMLSISLCEH